MRRCGLGVVAGVILGREGVDVAANPFHLLGDLFCGPLARAFEKQVLDEVRNAAIRADFMAPANCDPQPHRHAAHVRQIARSDAAAIGQSVQMVRVIHG